MCEHPLSVFGETLPTYFLTLAIGFGLAIWIATRWAKRAGLDHNPILDLGLFSIVLGVFGARLMHVIADGYFWDYVHLCIDPEKVAWPLSEAECLARGTHWDAVTELCRPAEADCWAWAAFWSGGLTYYGGLLLVVPFAMWFLRRTGFPAGKAADVAGMTIPLGLVWGRLGCFLGGCCFGRVTDHPIGVSFPAWSPASRAQWRAGALDEPYLASLPVHPTQLYEAIGCLALAAVLMLYLHPRKRFDGHIFLAFLVGYSILRFGLEFLRADDRGSIVGLSTSQFVSLIVVAVAAAAWPYFSRRRIRNFSG